ncbi:MAG: TIR domain protein [Muribaculum sp.]|nr:TIR domain protein [Muribaculum sp.]
MKTFSIPDNVLQFEICLYDNFYRLIRESNDNGDEFKDKTEIFISHSKQDADKTGDLIAQGLRDHLRRNHKLNSFYDANDILETLDFGEIIKEHVRKSILVIIESDTYSDREWCRIEAIEGKLFNVPAIRVDAIKGRVKRGFPYMSNIPEIRYVDSNYDEIIALILRTALDQAYQNIYLTRIKNDLCIDGARVQPLPPELFSIHKSHKDSDVILYPEPPLGTEEKDILENSFACKKFITPMQAMTRDIDLHHKNIAVSISTPENLTECCLSELMFNDMINEIARHIIIAKGDLVYGGDLRLGGFTNRLAKLAEQYGESERTTYDTAIFKNYIAWPIWLNLSRKDEAQLRSKRVEYIKVAAPEIIPKEELSLYFKPITLDEKFKFAISLSKMRKERNDNTSALIIMGGKTSDYAGILPGIIEEFAYAVKQQKPIFVIGSMGGASAIISECIQQSVRLENKIKDIGIDNDLQELLKCRGYATATDILDELSCITIDSLNNKLSPEENKILFSSTNIIEVIALILKGLNENFK